MNKGEYLEKSLHQRGVMGERSANLVENIDRHFREHRQFGHLTAFLLLFLLCCCFGDPGTLCVTRLVRPRSAYFGFVAAIGAPFCGFPRLFRLSG